MHVWGDTRQEPDATTWQFGWDPVRRLAWKAKAGAKPGGKGNPKQWSGQAFRGELSSDVDMAGARKWKDSNVSRMRTFPDLFNFQGTFVRSTH